MSHVSSTNCMSMNGWRDYFLDNPDDWLSYGIMADWLEERGNTFLARAARWMGRSGKRPQFHQRARTELAYFWVTGVAPDPGDPWPWMDRDAGATYHLPDNHRKTWRTFDTWWGAVAFLAHRLEKEGD